VLLESGRFGRRGHLEAFEVAQPISSGAVTDDVVVDEGNLPAENEDDGLEVVDGGGHARNVGVAHRVEGTSEDGVAETDDVRSIEGEGGSDTFVGALETDLGKDELLDGAQGGSTLTVLVEDDPEGGTVDG
jgi:hypothetical protein